MSYRFVISEIVFPVYAGVIPITQEIGEQMKGVPRVCGGDPIDLSEEIVPLGVFPVYAGVILRHVNKIIRFSGVPRVCGGDPTFRQKWWISLECSPCMRG